MDYEKYLHDPVVLGIAAGVVLLVIVLVLVRVFKREKGPTGRIVDDTKARARASVRDALRNFRDDIKRATETSAPVFAKIATESAQKDSVGHWRKTMKHRIQIRVPNFNGLKGTLRTLGYDAQMLIDLDNNWRKTGKQVADYNSGVHDASKIPITFAKEFEKDLKTMLLLANVCLTKYTA